ncbi:MAG: T9SS type A sorting domain-containing protein, partial [Chitinophagales bacterium]|nr:T9SS type A sorting domain-containing protein [Chitinophagales bacterium]
KGYIGLGGHGLKELWQYTPDCVGITVYADADADGYGDINSSFFAGNCLIPSGYVTDSNDCNDANASVHPGAIEVCSNGIDDNCDGQIDENCCSTPTGLATTNITSTSAQLNWNTVTSATKYTLQYKRDSTSVPWTSVTIIAPTTTKTITGLLTSSKYKWRVRSVCGSVKSAFSAVVKFTTLLRLGEESSQQSSLKVYPNPVITSSMISFYLQENSLVNIELLDLAGRKIKTLLNENLEAGDHNLKLNREQLSAGIYFLRIKMNNESSIIKIIIQ